ncbi:hypothetical protein GGI23_005836 [Coemansia sp. RSA 2559]|nr:hypothetical protein GGI23_005836 [Coemansia sp. RSA 2559]
MIDSLIKDADSALQSKPASNRFSTCSDDSVDIPGKISSFFSEPSSSMSGEFGETPTLVSDAEPGTQNSPSFIFTNQHSPCSLSGLEHRLAATAPRQWQQPHIRSYSPLPKYRAIVDPTEADAESDSEVSMPSVLRAQRRRMNHNGNNHIQRPYSSRSRRRGGSSSYYGERPSSKASRRRSNTVESVISNSSETCVSPVSRTSKEFHSTPVPCYIHSHTPAREKSRGFEKDMLVAPRDTEQCAFSAPTSASKNVYAFPRLSIDNGDARRVRTERRLSSPLIRRVPPLINRFRNTVTRAALRSASFVDGSVNDEIAAFEYGGGSSSSRDEQQPRTRSNTYGGGECSSVMFSQPPVRPDDLTCCSLTGIARHISGDNDQRQRSGSLIEGNSLVSPTAATDYAASKPQGDSKAAGILSVFSLIYWTLLFTLGVLMLDSFLCQVAGKRVMGTVDRIAQTEETDLLHSGRKRSNSRQRVKERADDDDEDTIDATGAVGRLVRWYIEDPEEAPGVRGLRLRKVQTARGLFKRVE